MLFHYWQSAPDLHAFVLIDEQTGTRLSAFKVPGRWTFVRTLPLNSIGKIDHKRLLEYTSSRFA